MAQYYSLYSWLLSTIVKERKERMTFAFGVLVAAALWSGTTKNPDVSIGLLAHPFAHTAHSFACSTLLASLARFAALIRSLAHFAHSLACGKVGILMSQNQAVLNHSAPMRRPREKIRR